ncbi:MAG TPA: crosslink repair DNA glycosylase YcaQ family protein, partial [Candidatus Limnocylindria bacterium]|nr:crosslink repair DNA glycosylase YcaQ family protein [Candidatus Limnocylindria bacterium]
MRTLTRADARRIAVRSQLLAGPRAGSLLEVFGRLGQLQVDPTSIVARAELLTLWSRLGGYDVGALRRLLEETRELFEYRAFLLPMADLELHRPTMERFPSPNTSRGRLTAEWLRDNAAFRDYVLGELERRGPLPSGAFDDRAEVPWQTGGWNDGKNVGQMLEALARSGTIAISRREGAERVWDLASRVWPETEPLPDEVVAIELLDRRLRAKGITTVPFGDGIHYELPARELALDSLRTDGVAVPVSIDGLPGEWVAHRDALDELDGETWAPRTALIGPFDPLIADRPRTEALFGMTYAFELYKPAATRQYGPYALVALDGDQLVGRIDARIDRKARVLTVHGWLPEPHATPSTWRAVAAELRVLGDWLGAT